MTIRNASSNFLNMNHQNPTSELPVQVGGKVEVRDKDGNLIFLYDPLSNSSVVYLSDGAFEIHQGEDNIDLIINKNLRVHSLGGIELDADEGVKLAAGNNALNVNPKSIELHATTLNANISKTLYEGDSIYAKAKNVKMVWGKVERIAKRSFDYACHAYIRVESLLHTRANRVRIEAVDSHFIQAESVRVHAKEDVKVLGKSINLG